MNTILVNAINAPVALFTDDRLTFADQRLWLCIMHDQTYFPNGRFREKTYLAARTRHSRTTVYSALKRLAAAGWYDPVKGLAVVNPLTGDSHPISVPVDLIFAEKLSDAAVVGHCRLQAAPRQALSMCRNKDLARFLGVCVNTARKIVFALHYAAWLILWRRKNKPDKRPYYDIVFDAPDRRYERNMHNALANRLARAKPSGREGEVIALTVIEFLADTECCVNGFHSFLHNPSTGEMMQLDAYLSKYNVGFEYNGKYHAEPEQAKRDQNKAGLMKAQDYPLFTLTVYDLSLERIAEKLRSAGVPLRDIRRFPTFMQTLIKRAQEVQRDIIERLNLPPVPEI